MNLRLGWMNQQRGSRVLGLLGKVVKVDVDGDGKASGAFLRGQVAIDIDKPLRRGVLLRMSKNEEPRWFAVQYEKLPFYCFACGVMGHSEVECDHSVERNDEGKLPYDVQLRAQDDRRRRLQSFARAAAESFSSGSSSASRPSKNQYGRHGGSRSLAGEDDSHFSSSDQAGGKEDVEVQSPLKSQSAPDHAGSSLGAGTRAATGKALFQ